MPIITILNNAMNEEATAISLPLFATTVAVKYLGVAVCVRPDLLTSLYKYLKYRIWYDLVVYNLLQGVGIGLYVWLRDVV